MKYARLTVLLMILLCSGCASIVGKSVQRVDVRSDPSGADLSIINRGGEAVFQGVTPANVMLKSSAGLFRPQKYKLTFQKSGYEMCITDLNGNISMWYIFGNYGLSMFTMGVGGVLGWVFVDPATGAMWTLGNPPLVYMRPQPGGTSSSDSVGTSSSDSIGTLLLLREIRNGSVN